MYIRACSLIYGPICLQKIIYLNINIHINMHAQYNRRLLYAGSAYMRGKESINLYHALLLHMHNLGLYENICKQIVYCALKPQYTRYTSLNLTLVHVYIHVYTQFIMTAYKYVSCKSIRVQFSSSCFPRSSLDIYSNFGTL